MQTWLEIRESDGLVVNASIGTAGMARPGHVAVVQAGDAWIGWRRRVDGVIVAPGAEIDLTVYAAGRRWDIVEQSRVQVLGYSVPTDKVTRDTLTAAYVKATANPGYSIADWKVAPGQYVTLNAAAIIAMANSVEAFVQTMFTRNKVADLAIAAKTATTTAHVDSILAGEAP